MKILLITTVDVSRRDNGKKVVIGGIKDFFTARGDLVIDLIPGSPNPTKNLPRPKKIEFFKNLIVDCLIRRKISIQECFFRAEDLINIVQKRVEELKPDIVILDTIRISQFVPFVHFGGAKVIIYLDDLFSVRYERMVASRSLSGSPLGNFRDRLPRWVAACLDRARWLLNLVLNFEAGLVRKSELRTVRLGLASYLISKQEVEYFNRYCFEAPNLKEIPPNLGIDSYVNRAWDGAPNFVFLGSLNLAHNISAVKTLIAGVFPSLLMRVPSARLRVIGGKPDPSLMKVMEASPFVDYLGYVEDVAQILSNSCALVAPIDFGSGVKLKLIDALSARLPIVTTVVGMEGVAMVDGVHGRITSGVDEFTSAMIEVADVEKNKIFSRNCGFLFDSYYSPGAISKIYSGIFSI